MKFSMPLGAEYWYNEQFAVRTGYFHENETKGNRKYFTVGAGFKLNIFALDFSYLIPTAQNNPLARTLRFSLAFDFSSPKERVQTKRMKIRIGQGIDFHRLEKDLNLWLGGVHIPSEKGLCCSLRRRCTATCNL